MASEKTWILVADSSKARIFSTFKAHLFNSRTDSLELIDQYTHNDSRKKDHDLVSDKLGMYNNGTFSPDTDPKAHEADIFAAQLIKQLLKSHQEGLYREIILVAPPAFMGLLNKHAQHQHLANTVSQTIEKDYTNQDERELVTSLAAHL